MAQEESKTKQKRGNKGDGSISNIGRNKWRVMVDFGINPATGKRDRPSRVVNGTKADARKVRDTMLKEREGGLRIEGDRMTLTELADLWAEGRKATGTANDDTIREDRVRIRHVERYIGNVQIRKIDALTVEQTYSRIKADKGLSGSSMRRIHTLLKNMFGKAVDYDLILRNPCDRVAAPKAGTPKRNSLSAADGARLLSEVDAAEKEAYSIMSAKETRQTERGNLFGRSEIRGIHDIGNIIAVRIGLATGMRRGEVFGLVWGNVALNQSCIHVRQTLTARGRIKMPKGDERHSVREVRIDSATAAHLEKWKRRQAIELLKIGIKQDDTTPVCCSDAGGWHRLDNFQRWWNAWRTVHGFDDLKFHELRHTQATQLLANGIDVKTVQERLGHSNASTTLNWYAHALPENDEKAALLIGELFAAKPDEPRIIEVKTA